MIKERVIDSIQLPNISIELERQGIVYITYIQGSIIDIEEKKEEREAVIRLTKGVKHPILFIFENMVTITRAAKEYSVKVEAETPFMAVALLAENFVHVISANFYLRFYNPNIPTKVFKTEVQATEWLLSEVAKFKSKSTNLSILPL
ncbi:MAG: hypothetical protein WCP52_00935 [Bacteroidota bacterium]